jgi:hypothetical protein
VPSRERVGCPDVAALPLCTPVLYARGVSEQPTARRSATSSVATTGVVAPETEAVPSTPRSRPSLRTTKQPAQTEPDVPPAASPDDVSDVSSDSPGDVPPDAVTGDVPDADATVADEAVAADQAVTPARQRRPRVRRVTRVVRHVDTWTVFKVAIVFHLVLYVSALVSGILLWNVAHGTGTVDNVERFMESFGWETFEFDGDQLFDAAWRVGLFLVVGLTGIAVLAATTFNLITDIVGGVRVTVLEEEVVAAPRGAAARSARRAARNERTG